ncbi:hypothetical protein BJ742DRAFT_840064 [Cladochytrium replicatum]|nr:hypothetical protein BJ742DRAFT_840064 [Cladochytrium replicatum]
MGTQQHESIELSASSSATRAEELPPEYDADSSSSTQLSIPTSNSDGSNNATPENPDDFVGGSPVHAYPPPVADAIPPDAPPPPGELLPSYTYVTAPPPKYSEKNIFKLLRSRKLQLLILALSLLGIAITIAIVVLTQLSKQSGPSLTVLIVQEVFATRFLGAAIGAGKWRHIAGNEYFGVAVIERVSSSSNGTSAIVVVRKNHTQIFTLESGVTVSYMAPYSPDTFYALSTTNDTMNLVQFGIGRDHTARVAPLSVFNLTNITSPAFQHPVLEASMYLSYSMNNSRIFVALADSNSTTWLYRIRLPSYIEGNSTILGSTRGHYRFAESTGFADPESNDVLSSILMLPSAPVPTIYDAYAMLQPKSLSIILPVKPSNPTFHLFLGAPYRGSLSPDGTAGMVMGDKALVAANSAELTRNSSVRTDYGHFFDIYPRDWGKSPNNNVGGNLTEVLVHVLGEYTIRGVDRAVVLRGTRSTVYSTSSSTAASYGYGDIGLEVESLANAGPNAFYAMGVRGEDVLIKKINVSKSSA